MTAIDIDYAWRSLRDACTGRGDGMTPAVTIEADGRWRAEGAVEPEAAALLHQRPAPPPARRRSSPEASSPRRDG